MTEAESIPTSKTPPFNTRGLWDIVCGILILSLCAIAFLKGPIWPDKIGIAAGIVPPWLLILFRAWNRRLRPDRLVVRWPQASRLEARLVALGWGLTAIFGIFMSFWVLLGESKHLVADHTCFLVAFTAQCWAEFVDRYISDHKYTRPSGTPSDPSTTWLADVKPPLSEHWLPNSDPNVVP
jgi:hypothetical protein